MKTERRTELKSNLLADRLEAVILAVKPHLKTMGIVAAGLVVVGIGYAISQWQTERASADAWSEYYFSASRPETLREVYDNHPTQLAGLWARQASGDSLLAQAIGQIYVDRDLADKLLVEAGDHYRAVLEKGSEGLLVCRASFGLAQVLESQGKGEDALREYKKLLAMKDVHPEMRDDLQRRIAFLQSPEGGKFVDWFSKNRAAASKAVQVPADLKSLPNQPDLNFASPPTTVPSVENIPTAETVPAGDLKLAPSTNEILTPPSSDANATPAAAKVEEPAPIKPPALEPPAEPKGSGS